MNTRSVLALIAFAGASVAHTTAAAGNSDPLPNRTLIPTSAAGVLYINMATGERTLTRFLAGSTGTAIPEIDTHGIASGGGSGGALFDYWMSVDENPCWDDRRANHLPGSSFGVFLDTTNDTANGITEPMAAFDFGDMPFDSRITGITLTTATLATEDIDSNGDGVLDTGIDTVAVYYDALSEGNHTSIAPPTAVVRVESIPGNTGTIPDGFEHYDLVLDFGGEHFELGDSDGQNLGSLWLAGAASGFDLSALISVCTGDCVTPDGVSYCCGISFIANPNADGYADFQYLQYYAQHGTDEKVTADSTFIGLGTPEGTVAFSTFITSTTTITITPTFGMTTFTTILITVTETTLTADPIPQGQSAFESYGLGSLGPGNDHSFIDWSPAGQTLGFGCCYWFGGLDCVGFLDQLVDSNPPITDYNPTWYNFTPYAQLSHGFFSHPVEGFDCFYLDLDGDTFITGGDLRVFITLFLAGELAADFNGDSYLDHGDITLFVEYFLSCVG